MKIRVYNTPYGLIPCYDEDYEKRQKLKLNQEYVVDIKTERNAKFHRLYFAFLRTAWAYLPEAKSNGFRSFDNFRYYIEVAAGHCIPFYSPKRNEWVEVPKSINFETMEEDEFKDLYQRVKDVVFGIIGQYVTPEEFDKNLSRF